MPFRVAIDLFADPFRVVADASRSEDGETRLKVYGRANERMMVVVFTVRGTALRIISPRRAHLEEAIRHGYRESDVRSE